MLNDWYLKGFVKRSASRRVRETISGATMRSALSARSSPIAPFQAQSGPSRPRPPGRVLPSAVSASPAVAVESPVGGRLRSSSLSSASSIPAPVPALCSTSSADCCQLSLAATRRTRLPKPRSLAVHLESVVQRGRVEQRTQQVDAVAEAAVLLHLSYSSQLLLKSSSSMFRGTCK